MPETWYNHCIHTFSEIYSQQVRNVFKDWRWLLLPGAVSTQWRKSTLSLTSSKRVKRASQVVKWVKNLPAMQVTWVQSLRWEDPLEEGMATHPHIIASRIPWKEEPGELQSIGSQRVGHDWSNWAHTGVRTENKPTSVSIFLLRFSNYQHIFTWSLGCGARLLGRGPPKWLKNSCHAEVK